MYHTICDNKYIYIYMYVKLYVHMSRYMYMYMSMPIYMYIYIYIYEYSWHTVILTVYETIVSFFQLFLYAPTELIEVDPFYTS